MPQSPTRLTLTLALAVSLTPAALADEWESAFSKAEEDESAASSDEAAEPEETMTIETTLSSSFPMRLEFGTTKEIDWKKAPPAALAPKKIRKKLKVGKCQFSLETGTFIVSKYGVSGIGEYSVETPAFPAQTRVALVPNENIFLSVSAELNVRPIGRVQDCKRLFKAKERRPLPDLVLGDTLAGIGDGKVLKPVRTVREAQGDKLFIAWDASEKTLRLENRDGVKPMIESPIVKFEHYAEGGFFLTYTPSWKLVRSSAQK